VHSHDWDERYAQHDQLWSGEANARLIEVASGLPPGRALELGSGEGADAIWLAGRGWTVTAVDFSTVALERAAREGTTRGVNVTWVNADLRGYVPPPAAFDLVLLFYLHLPPAERAPILARAAASVAPGGRLLVVGHDRTNPPEAHGPKHHPEVLYTPEEIARDLAGLSIERADRVTEPQEIDGRTVRAVDTLVLARRPLPTRP
jgi:SAM-dependent methyltransferase